MSAEEIANAFTQHYYSQFDTNPDGLGGLFVRDGVVVVVVLRCIAVFAVMKVHCVSPREM